MDIKEGKRDRSWDCLDIMGTGDCPECSSVVVVLNNYVYCRYLCVCILSQILNIVQGMALDQDLNCRIKEIAASLP